MAEGRSSGSVPESRSALLAVFALVVFLSGLNARTLWLYWSPYPATLDGFRYVVLVQGTLADGGFPAAEMTADEFGYTSVVAAGSLVTGEGALLVSQPLVAVIGAGSCLSGMAVAWRLGLDLEWPRRRATLAATLAGLALAVSGVYLRRTGVSDEEALGILLIPLLALAAHRALQIRRVSWAVVAGLFLAVLPTIHDFSAVVGAVTLLALAALHAANDPSTRTLLLAIAVSAGSWLYLLAYFSGMALLGLSLSYTDRLLDHPWLFGSWLVVLVVGVVWFRRASTRSQRAVFLVPILAWFGLAAANSVLPVFPETVPTPPLVGGLVAAYLVAVLVAGYGIPLCGSRADRSTAPVILALLATPVVLVYFALTAALTADFFDTVIRTQTFAHFPMFVLSALGAAWLAMPRSRATKRFGGVRRALSSTAIRVGVVSVFLVGALVTMPLAFVALDTGAAPSTTTESQLQAAIFSTSHLDESFATDDPMARLTSWHRADYLGDGPGGSQMPTREWLHQGIPPGCPTLTRESWTSTGAHLYPAGPGMLSPAEHDAWLEERNLVYVTSGEDPQYLAVPRDGRSGC